MASLFQNVVSQLAERWTLAAKPKPVIPFREFLEETSPRGWRFDWAHSVLLQETLERVTSGEIEFLMITMPPRHNKSETVTVRYSAYRLERDKHIRVIIGCYNSTLAAKFGRKIKRICEKRFQIATDRKAADNWETPEGGGVQSVGVKAGVTGSGGDLIIIDDPVKNRAEAESAAYREACWEWYTDDIFTRREPGCAMILIMTRWHHNDLAGRILESEEGKNWTVLNLPALAEENDILGRPYGAALCPDRYDEQALALIRSVEGEYGFNALYQGRPTAKEGNFFKVFKIRYCKILPAGLVEKRAWDFAASTTGNWTVGVKGGYLDGITYITDVVRDRLDPEERDALILQTAQKDGVEVEQRFPQDPGAAGKSQIAYLIRELAGFFVSAELVGGSKEDRAHPLASQMNVGNVTLLDGPWNEIFVDEFRTFPLGLNDDQVDAAADLFTMVTTGFNPPQSPVVAEREEIAAPDYNLPEVREGGYNPFRHT